MICPDGVNQLIRGENYFYHLEQGLLLREKNCIKNENRQYILENYLRYFFIQKDFYDSFSAEQYSIKILKKLCKGAYKNKKRYKYSKPQNKWVQEELLYGIIKTLYKKYNVIYQYRPTFLKSKIGGQMSYDIFIKNLKLKNKSIKITVFLCYEAMKDAESLELDGRKLLIRYSNEKKDSIFPKLVL
mgnify:CR=1 FL=1